MSITPADTAAQHSIIVEALTDSLRAKLRAHFEEQAKPIISEMVEACLKDMNVAVNSYRHLDRMCETIEFVLTDKTRVENRW